jgi:sugar phosphate isomerase/epimerase
MAGAYRRGELAYCSNVHPGETLAEVEGVLARYLAAVRQARGLPVQAAGLWLAADAARSLAADARALTAFRTHLDQAGITLHTLNGFPYGGFHAQRVKEKVYRPDWSEPARLDYTLALARVLAACLPEEAAEGSLSTLPLGDREGWDAARQQQALARLCRLTQALAELEDETGRRVRVCLEMEPGCVLERTQEAIDLFTRDLPAAAKAHGVPAQALTRHLGVCYDVCHQAVMHEDPGESLAALGRAGITVGKIQVSSALEVPEPAHAPLAPFAEPRYLHQVRSRAADGRLLGCADLPEALAGAVPTERPWRVHFHLPLQADGLAHGRLATTRGAMDQVLAFLAQHPEVHPHLEVETYTWQVLPPDLRPTDDASLVRGIGEELTWLEGRLDRHGLLAGEAP